MQYQWKRQGAVWRRIRISPSPPRPERAPDSVRFEIVYDEDQGKLQGLPFYGFAARIKSMGPNDNPDFEQLAEWCRAAVDDYISELISECSKLL